jgi:hypothetical protein
VLLSTTCNSKFLGPFLLVCRIATHALSLRLFSNRYSYQDDYSRKPSHCVGALHIPPNLGLSHVLLSACEQYFFFLPVQHGNMTGAEMKPKSNGRAGCRSTEASAYIPAKAKAGWQDNDVRAKCKFDGGVILLPNQPRASLSQLFHLAFPRSNPSPLITCTASHRLPCYKSFKRTD